MTERRLCLGIMGRRRRNRWPDCGKHFAQPVQEKKTEALTGTQHFLLLFDVFTVSYINSGIS